MKELILKRIADDGINTYGVLIDNNIPFVVTLEPTWKNNENNVSCIPTGHYECRRRWYNSGSYSTFRVLCVPNRYDILFHRGNIGEHTKGCILIGESFDKLFFKNKWWNAILSSQKGFKEFMKKFEFQNTFNLLVVDCTKEEDDNEVYV